METLVEMQPDYKNVSMHPVLLKEFKKAEKSMPIEHTWLPTKSRR
jgi:hypothetical protein